MSKNLKINGIYNNLTDGENFNIFSEVIINFNDCKISIKNCEINGDIIKFNNFNYNYNYNLKNIDNNIIKNSLNLIKNIIDNGESYYEGDFNIYLQNLINFIFQYIYNEIYIQGNLTFTNIVFEILE